MMAEKKPFFRGVIAKITGSEVPAEVSPSPGTGTAAGQAGLFDRLRQGLGRTHDSLTGRIDQLVWGKKQIDASLLEELEEILIGADLGVTVTTEITRTLEERLSRNQLSDGGALLMALKEELVARLVRVAAPLDVTLAKPFVIMVIGVNGVGKTTTVGKLASQFTAQGMRVLLAAGDTFRAAAAEQLAIWGERAGAELIRHQSGADPSAVVFDGCRAALARGADILLVDTAGRLHTKTNLMEELKKICRVMGREIPGAPHEILLVLDAATGQNAISQAKLFKEATQVSGIVLTKLDGTAKGGIVVAIGSEFHLPVRFIGVGEGVDDLRAFDPTEFVAAIF
jgi:fused signal recognition particle receptor